MHGRMAGARRARMGHVGLRRAPLRRICGQGIRARQGDRDLRKRIRHWFSAGRARRGTAAALLAVSFFAFATSKVSFIQFFGLGTGFAILIDATLVRGILVPAFMRAFGENSWYAPSPLRKLHNRIGLSDAEPPALELAGA